MDNLRTTYREQIEELAAAARRLGELGYVTSHGGNLSYRVSDTAVLITPTKVEKRKMTADDIVIVDRDAKVLSARNGRRPTGETPMHLHLFRLRPDLNALVHAHPPLLTGFSMVDAEVLTTPLLPEPILEIGPVVMIPFAEPITEELARQFEAHAWKSNIWLMQNHGVTLGSSEGVERALDMLQMAECMADSVRTALSTGKPMTFISRAEVAKMERTLATRKMPRPGDPRRIASLVQLYFGA